MADVYMYADETGNLDYDDPRRKEGATKYFGFGTAVFQRDHGHELWEGLKLRARIESEGINLPKGFHGKDDKASTKARMFDLISKQAPRFDMTFLCKENAYPRVRDRGEMYLYRMAWYLHFKEVSIQVAKPGDTLFAVVSSFGTKARATAARQAVNEVCEQVDRRIVLCIWDGPTSWGLQVADYGLWAAQRALEEKRCSWYEPCVKPTQQSFFLPWGRAK